MGIMDKVKAQAEAGLAKAAEAGKAGQAKLDAVQAKRHADSLLAELGYQVYCQQAGRGDGDTEAEMARLTDELAAYEAEYGTLTR
ncbi:MAG: hypothetical protein M0007_08070 [Actinomycetota bacterium]|jgi:hypothetical protein|nr:hypothetical protein [Actinomycetota bacterium]